MHCVQCGSDNRSGRRFCSGCGSRRTAACPGCGFANAIDEKFCGGCGADLAVSALPPAAVLETERKYVTLLFADIRGSLEIIADRDPEEAQAVLDPVLERLVRSVNAFGGTVNRTNGDGLMALFGAPIAYEDHALRAASAAVAMLQAVRELAREPKDRPLSRFIGRSLEMGGLAETLQKERSGHGQLVAVVGEPGVGKSRLFLEFMRSPEVEGCLVLESGSESFGPTNPMVPVIELARGYLNVERGDDLATVNAKLEHRLAGIEGEDRDEIFNAFQALLVPDDELPLRRIGNPAERQYRILNGVAKA